MELRDAYIVSTARTAVGRGKADGALAPVHPIDLSVAVMQAAVERAGIDPAAIDDVQWGCAMPEAAQGLNVARLAVLRAGFPVEVPAATVNRFCASGLETIASGARAIMTGMNDVVLAGGVEMMSQVPMSGYHTRLHPAIVEAYISMGHTAERVADRYTVSRADQDEWALRSHQRAAAAQDDGRFRGEIVPVQVTRGAGRAVTATSVDTDELIRRATSIEQLGALRPVFAEGGSVTAGNSSPFSDGAAGVVLASAGAVERLGLTPVGRFVTHAVTGVAPDMMGIAPITAIAKALRQAGMSLTDIDLIELNEAFSSQVLAVIRESGLDPDRVNVNGGAIALGHPLGATGAKLVTQIVHELGRRGGGTGLVTMCIGGGMGAAGIIEVNAN